MKSKWTGITGVAAFLFLTVSGFAQQRTVLEFTGSGVPQANPFPVRGLVKCVGAGNPAPADQDTPPWCPAGTQTSMMGRILVGKWATSDPNTTGDMRWYMNFSVDSATFAGSWWGSFILDVPGKGTWEGWFWGESTAKLSTYRLIGIGHGGFDQSTLMAEMSQESGRPATMVGRYLQPQIQKPASEVLQGDTRELRTTFDPVRACSTWLYSGRPDARSLRQHEIDSIGKWAFRNPCRREL